MTKIAGASLVGFCAVSFGADKFNLNPIASQLAGFAGAFLGSMAAQRRRPGPGATSPNATAQPEETPQEK